MSEVEQKEDPELIDILPIDASMSGRNSVYQFCGARQQQASYAVCLHTIEKIKAGTLSRDLLTECQRAYVGGYCPAKKMREQEEAAGHALFFIPRPRHITDPVTKSIVSGAAVSSGKYDMSSASYARGWAIGGSDGYNPDKESKKPKRVVPPPAPKKKSGFVEEGMADVVNVLMKENATKPAAVEEPKPQAPVSTGVTSSRPLPGESTADFIKRRASERTAK